MKRLNVHMKRDKIRRIQMGEWLLIILLGIGFIATFGYGIYLDQDLEQEILFSNILEYLKFVPDWFGNMANDIAESGIIGIRQYKERDHGIAVYYPISFIWHLNKSHAWIGDMIWKGYTFLVCSLGFFAFY